MRGNVVEHALSLVIVNVIKPLPHRPRQRIAILVRIQMNGQGKLPEVVEALSPIGLFFASDQGRQQQRGEDGNDRDDHEQFDQCEGGAPLHRMYP